MLGVRAREHGGLGLPLSREQRDQCLGSRSCPPKRPRSHAARPSCSPPGSVADTGVPCVRPSICPLRGSLCVHAAAEWTAKRGRNIVTAEGP